jgi:hypothetical protein
VARRNIQKNIGWAIDKPNSFEIKFVGIAIRISGLSSNTNADTAECRLIVRRKLDKSATQNQVAVVVAPGQKLERSSNWLLLN